MSKYVDEERLFDALKTFNTITKLKVTVYSSTQEVIMEYPVKNSKLCIFLNKNSYCNKLCKDSNYQAFLKVNNLDNLKKGYYIYTCYAGLLEAIVPLTIDKETIGYVMFGQITNNENKEEIFNKLNKLKDIVDLSEAKKYVNNIAVHGDETIEAEAKLLSICSKYFIQDSIVRKKDSNTLDLISAYINNKKFNHFNVDELCEYVAISRTKLYTLFKNEYKIGIAEYIRNLKLNEAQRLLKETKYSVKKIAYMVDLGDANSFIKIFKKKYNYTPLEYRDKKKITG